MKLSVQSGNVVDELGYEEGYRLIAEAGFEAIDWNLDHSWTYSKLQKAAELKDLCIFEKELPEILAHYEEELACIRKNNLSITQAHAPFRPYEPGRPDILEYAISIYRKMILFCEAVGCPRLVVHGIALRFEDEPTADAEANLKLNLHLYESLIPELQKTSVTVCLENLFSRYDALDRSFREGNCSDPHEAVYLIDTLNEKAGKTCFGLCLDTGHLNLLRRNPRTYISILGSRIVALHLHDNSQENDRHLMPYAGNICWPDYLRELKKAGYCGDISFETFAQVQLKRIPRELIPHFLRLIAQVGAYFRKELL